MAKSSWQYFKESYEQEVVGEKRTFYRNGIKRADGFTMLKLVSWDDDRYWCRGDFGELRFVAKRRENPESIPSERYVVYPDAFDPKWPGDKKKNRELCLAHLKDIEDGLLHFPTVFYFGYMPEEPYSLFKEEDSENPEVVEAANVHISIKGFVGKIKSCLKRK